MDNNHLGVGEGVRVNPIVIQHIFSRESKSLSTYLWEKVTYSERESLCKKKETKKKPITEHPYLPHPHL